MLTIVQSASARKQKPTGAAAPSLLQRAERTDNMLPARRAVQLLSTAGSQLHSAPLVPLVFNALIDHFYKVRGLIKDQLEWSTKLLTWTFLHLVRLSWRMAHSQTIEGKNADISSTQAAIYQLKKIIETTMAIDALLLTPCLKRRPTFLQNLTRTRTP